jgi:PLP dependent protein
MKVKERYEKLRKKISDCSKDSLEPLLVAVSKQASCSQIQEAYEAGCMDFGENRVKDALDKISLCSDQIRWHFIGTLQSNKISKVVGVFETIQSVNTVKLAKGINERAGVLGIRQKVFLQVNTSEEISKHGLTVKEALACVNELNSLSNLDWQGFMTIGPASRCEEDTRKCFKTLKNLRKSVQGDLKDNKVFSQLSMGMSGDYLIAIEEGSGILRVGSAIFCNELEVN